MKNKKNLIVKFNYESIHKSYLLNKLVNNLFIKGKKYKMCLKFYKIFKNLRNVILTNRLKVVTQSYKNYWVNKKLFFKIIDIFKLINYKHKYKKNKFGKKLKKKLKLRIKNNVKFKFFTKKFVTHPKILYNFWFLKINFFYGLKKIKKRNKINYIPYVLSFKNQVNITYRAIKPFFKKQNLKKEFYQELLNVLYNPESSKLVKHRKEYFALVKKSVVFKHFRW